MRLLCNLQIKKIIIQLNTLGKVPTIVKSSHDWDITMVELSSLSCAVSRPTATSRHSSWRNWLTRGVSRGEGWPEEQWGLKLLALNRLVRGATEENTLYVGDSLKAWLTFHSWMTKYFSANQVLMENLKWTNIFSRICLNNQNRIPQHVQSIT